ncbi:hypothetical protein SISNIDRAFT_448812 [Sistotremastrum niveocremeum HHB9708]|uniref:LysM domain-containing protein n=2 Tax=Sistotremastraceae TaxID=3402574 RepID=A0A165A6I7_9AGAM|nr:hypothetical protein SISNIDRAFT_448812 [Sistotremastrum niveocremeum HHB9708]KZT43526.1 hypothetical protein SISSUDRAFT_997146 [Sistotremastrum suecicum HHB10207 ss-3]
MPSSQLALDQEIWWTSDTPSDLFASELANNWPSQDSTDDELQDERTGADASLDTVHPLIVTSSSDTNDTLDITRPNLRRMLSNNSESTPPDARPHDSASSNNAATHTEPEAQVIVHEVSATDSLAGVAIKYGVPVAQIRRANKLWSTDSIHLRKTLYIPLAPSLDRPERATLKPPLDPSTEIRRIPAKALSFFPSSQASSPSTSGTDSELHSRNDHPDNALAIKRSRFYGIQLPDSIITRLSLDSLRSHDDEQAHEMGVVQPSKVDDNRVIGRRASYHDFHSTERTPVDTRGDGWLSTKTGPSARTRSELRVVNTQQPVPTPSMRILGITSSSPPRKG